MDDPGLGIDVENRLVLGVRQARHAADHGDRPVGPHVAVHARLGAQRGIARLARDHNALAALAVHVGVPRRRPLDRDAGQVAEPAQRRQFHVMAVLRPHRYRVEGQAENVDGGDGAQERVGVGERVGYGLNRSVAMSAPPDDSVRISCRPQLGRFIKGLQQAQEIPTGGFRASDFHQVEHDRKFPADGAGNGAWWRRPGAERGYYTEGSFVMPGASTASWIRCGRSP